MGVPESWPPMRGVSSTAEPHDDGPVESTAKREFAGALSRTERGDRP